MPKAMIDNVAGHRAKYDHLVAHAPASDVGQLYVGASDPILTGFHELEAIRSYASLDGASVVDIGCGIGRLTQHMIHENVISYLGTDIIPEILESAKSIAINDDRFSFSIASECNIPADSKTIDVVAAFSVITHLVDEEVFEYISEARRVLKDKGVAIFSFLDFMNPIHQPTFFRHASQHRHGHGDMLKFLTKEVLTIFAKQVDFTSIDFLDGQSLNNISGKTSKLVDISKTSQTFQTGQSLCVMTVS